MERSANQAEELSSRLLDFAIRVIRLVRALPKAPEARHVARQLLRSGTSPGANHEEACGAESRGDFAHKVGVVLKELKESRYWLRIAKRVPLVKPASRLDPLLEDRTAGSDLREKRSYPAPQGNRQWQEWSMTMANDKWQMPSGK